MKKAILLAASALVVSMMVSCEEKETKDVETSVENQSQYSKVAPSEEWGLHRHLVLTSDTCYCAKGEPYNCFDDIVIVATPIRPGDIEELEAQPLQESIIWNTIASYLENEPDVLAKLKTGDYMVKTLTGKGASKILCGVFLRGSNNIEYTFQFATK